MHVETLLSVQLPGSFQHEGRPVDVAYSFVGRRQECPCHHVIH
jgi:hypothetical protein